MNISYRFGIILCLMIAFSSPAISEENERITVSDFDVAMRPEPDSFKVVTRIPKASKVRVLSHQSLQQGPATIKWYEVEYKGSTGWISGASLEGEEMEYSLKYESPYSGRSSIAGSQF